MWQKNYDGCPALYLVPTPIGNMEDITFRAINVLKEVSIIFSEDTRVTKNLLNYFEINNKLIALHDHNEDVVKDIVLKYLMDGKNVAIVTDRGTPIISDPGYKTVKFVSDAGFRVVGLPGACAFVPALIVSGIAPQPFTFYGFLDSKVEKKRKELEKLKFIENTIIFYEAPHRILKTMEMILEVFGDRDVSLSREISKKYESVYRGKISNLISTLENIKGEFVVVVAGFSNNIGDDELSVVEQIDFYIANGMRTMDAIKVVSKERGMKKNDVYAEYHKGGNL